MATNQRTPLSRAFAYVDQLIVNKWKVRFQYETNGTESPTSVNITASVEEEENGNYFAGTFHASGQQNMSFTKSFDFALVTAILQEVQEIFAGVFDETVAEPEGGTE